MSHLSHYRSPQSWCLFLRILTLVLTYTCSLMPKNSLLKNRMFGGRPKYSIVAISCKTNFTNVTGATYALVTGIYPEIVWSSEQRVFYLKMSAHLL